jgi:hypothetical protein
VLNFFKKSAIEKTVRCLMLFVCLFLFIFLAFGDKLDIKYFTANISDSISGAATSLLTSNNKLGMETKYFAANISDSISGAATSLLAFGDRLVTDMKYFAANISDSLLETTTPTTDTPIDTTTPTTDTPDKSKEDKLKEDKPIDESTDSLFDLLVDIIISSTDTPDENSLIDTTTSTTDTPVVDIPSDSPIDTISPTIDIPTDSLVETTSPTTDTPIESGDDLDGSENDIIDIPGDSLSETTTPTTDTPEPEPEPELEPEIDQSHPFVSKVSSPILEGTFKSGVVPITVSFNEAVNVSGKPQLIISTGDPATTVATYKSHSRNLLFFQLRVYKGNYSSRLDYASSSSLILNGGEIKDKEGNNAILTLPQPGSLGSLSSYTNIVIDATK